MNGGFSARIGSPHDPQSAAPKTHSFLLPSAAEGARSGRPRPARPRVARSSSGEKRRRFSGGQEDPQIRTVQRAGSLPNIPQMRDFARDPIPVREFGEMRRHGGFDDVWLPTVPPPGTPRGFGIFRDLVWLRMCSGIGPGFDGVTSKRVCPGAFRRRCSPLRVLQEFCPATNGTAWRSRLAPRWKSRFSECQGPATWSPRGRPAFVQPHGIERAG